MKKLSVIIAAALFLAGGAICISASAANNVVNIGSRLELLVDNHMVARMKNVAFRLHSPIEREVVLTLDAPWEGKNSAYFTVLKDDDTYRMYYRGCTVGEKPQEVTCLAESKDGINFTRPSFGIYDFRGSKDNNIVYMTKGNWRECHNFTPFVDVNPKARPDEKYKAIAWARKAMENGEEERGLGVFTSPDGIHWKQIGNEAVFMKGAFDSQNVSFWDTNRNEYVCYFRMPVRDKKGVGRTTSADFVNWTDPQPMDCGKTVPEHFYTNAIQPYFRDLYWYFGLPMRFMHPKDRNQIGADDRETDGFSDAVFISSRDGINFDRTCMDALIRPGLNQYNWGNAHINQTPACGIVQTTPEELSIYWCDNYDDIPRIKRGTVRIDGFVSMNAPHKGGEFTTKPFIFTGNKLVINYSTSAAGSLKIEVQDANGKPIPGYKLNDFKTIWGDEIERVVSWKYGNDLSKLAGTPIRLRFVMSDADLYSYRFKN